MSDILVVYYSRKGENYMPGGIQPLEKGHTERAAEYIRDASGADLFEIKTVKSYAEHYRECCAQAAEEMKSGARPAIRGFVEDISRYRTVFVCFPCWCGTAPMCVFTFLEHYDLTGKTVIPLCTNEGSGMGNALKDLQRSCKGAEVRSGLAVLGHQVENSKDQLTDWAKTQI